MTIALTILGAVASLVGIYGVYFALRAERKKSFAYEVSNGFEVASASRVDGDYELSVHFRTAGGVEEKIEGASLCFVRLANLGKEPIYSQDIAPANPLRIEVSDARVLDIAIADAKREVNQISLAPPDLSDEGGSAVLRFDFLDYGDGALIRILTAGSPAKVQVVGDIIGMPKGIICTTPEKSGIFSFALGFGLWAIAEVILLGAAVWLFHEQTNSWSDAWLMLVPVPVFFVPLVTAALLSESGSKLRRASLLRRAYPELRFPQDSPYGRFLFELPVGGQVPRSDSGDHAEPGSA